MRNFLFLCLASLSVCALACSYDSNYSDSCDHTKFTTYCNESYLVSCTDNDEIEEHYCSDGCDSKTNTCVDTCGGIGSKGMCDGNVAKVCVNGEIQSQTCATGTKCGKRPADGQVDCIKDESAGTGDSEKDDKEPAKTEYVISDPCPDGLTLNGICDGNRAVFCDNGKIGIEDCSKTRCMVKESYAQPFAECYEECGDIDYAGKCASKNGTAGYKYCHEKEGLLFIQCNTNETCQLVKGNYECK